MSAAIKLLTSTTATPSASAANDPRRSPAAATAISDMRAALGRSSLESTWAKLADQAKAMILYGAKLRPKEFLHIPLSAMTADEREQIRMAIVAMQNAVQAFGRQDMSRHAFGNISKAPAPKSPMPAAITKHRPDKLEVLQELVAELAQSEQKRTH